MAHPLTLTLKLKQDEESLAKLQKVKDDFAEKIQPVIDAAFAESKIVHFGRLLIIDDKYLLVITEFDGSKQDYTEFFRDKLKEIFKVLFSLAEDAPENIVEDSNAFYKYSKTKNAQLLGVGADEYGYMFSAYGDLRVKQIKPAIEQAGLEVVPIGP